MPRSICSSIPKPKLPSIIIKIIAKRATRPQRNNPVKSEDEDRALTIVGEVFLSELKFLDLEASLDELLSLVTADGNVHCNLFVSLDGEGPDGVAGLGLDGLLVGEILEHLGRLGKLVAGLACAEIENELFDLDFSHLVVELFLLLLWLLHIFFLSSLNLLIIINEYFNYR